MLIPNGVEVAESIEDSSASGNVLQLNLSQIYNKNLEDSDNGRRKPGNIALLFEPIIALLFESWNPNWFCDVKPTWHYDRELELVMFWWNCN